MFQHGHSTRFLFVTKNVGANTNFLTNFKAPTPSKTYTMEIHLLTFNQLSPCFALQIFGWEWSYGTHGVTRPTRGVDGVAESQGKTPCSSSSCVFKDFFKRIFIPILGEMIPYDSQVDVAHIFSNGLGGKTTN